MKNYFLWNWFFSGKFGLLCTQWPWTLALDLHMSMTMTMMMMILTMFLVPHSTKTKDGTTSYYRPWSEGDNVLGSIRLSCQSVRPTVRLFVCLCSRGWTVWPTTCGVTSRGKNKKFWRAVVDISGRMRIITRMRSVGFVCDVFYLFWLIWVPGRWFWLVCCQCMQCFSVPYWRSSVIQVASIRTSANSQSHYWAFDAYVQIWCGDWPSRYLTLHKFEGRGQMSRSSGWKMSFSKTWTGWLMLIHYIPLVCAKPKYEQCGRVC